MRGTAVAAVLAAMLFQIPSARSQESQEARSDDVYIVAMRTALEARAKAYSSLGEKDYFSVFVEQRTGITERLPKRLGLFNLTVLDGEGMRRRFNEVGRFPFLSISPMTNSGNQFVVNIGDRWFSYRRGILFIRRAMSFSELEGGTEVKFHYDVTTDSFIVDQAKLWGI